MDVYEGIAPMRFQRKAAKQAVLEHTIICDVNASVDKVKKNAKPEMSINKQQHNKIVKLMDNVGKTPLNLIFLISKSNRARERGQ